MEWLDSAKATGMILVYIGHCGIPDLNLYIYLFHMPLFFIISGFLWNVDKNRDMEFKTFARKKFKAYIIPYFKIAVICFVAYGIGLNLIRLGGLAEEYWIQLAKYIFGIVIYSRGTVEWLPQCSPIWFLTCLFVAEIIYYFLLKLKFPVAGVIVAGLLGYIFSGWVKLPWNIDSALSAVVLLYIGTQARRFWHLLTDWRTISLVSAIAIVTVLTNETQVDFDGNNYSNMLAMYVKSTIISISLLTLIYKWGGWKWLATFGRETIVLLGYNYILNTLASEICHDNPYLMPFVVIPLGAMLALLARKYGRVRKIIV